MIKIRHLLVAGIVISMLAACGRPAAGNPMPTATSAATTARTTPTVTPTELTSTSPEIVIADYWQALAEHKANVAYDLLTPVTQGRTSVAELTSAATAIKSLTVVQTEPPADGADHSTYRVELQVTPTPGAASPWNAGSNPRWMDLRSAATGWHINEISSSPLVGEAGSAPRTWQRVDLAQGLGLSFEVPKGWEQLGVETAWGEHADGIWARADHTLVRWCPSRCTQC